MRTVLLLLACALLAACAPSSPPPTPQAQAPATPAPGSPTARVTASPPPLPPAARATAPPPPASPAARPAPWTAASPAPTAWSWTPEPTLSPTRRPISPMAAIAEMMVLSPTPIVRATPQAPAALPETMLGYGQALAAAFLPGDEGMVVATESGLLFLRLRDLATLRFVPLESGGGELAVSPDGRFIAVGQGGGIGGSTTSLLTSDGRLLQQLGGASPRFSADGRLLATTSVSMGGSMTDFFRLEGSTWQRIGNWSGNSPALSPDGSLVAVVNIGVVELNRPDGGAYHLEKGSDVAIHPDGTLVAIAARSGIELIEIEDGELNLASRRTVARPSFDVAFSADGSRLLTTDVSGARAWSMPDGRPLYTIPGGESYYFRFSPAGELIESYQSGEGAPSQLRLYRSSDGAEVYSPAEGNSGVAAYSPDERQILLASLSGYTLVDLEQGVLARRSLMGLRALAFTADGAIVATTADGTVERWATTAGDLPESVGGPFGDTTNEVRRLISIDDRILVTYERIDDTRARLLVASELAGPRGEIVLREERLPPRRKGVPPSPPWDYSPPAGLLAWVDSTSALLVDNPAGGPPRPLPAVRGLPGDAAPTTLAFSPDGQRLAIGYDAGALAIVRAGDLSPLGLTPVGAGEAVTALAWSGDGRLVAAGLADGMVAVWEAGEDEPPTGMAGPWAEPITTLALSDDGATLAMTSRGGAAALTVADGAELLRVAGPVTGVAVAPDGGRVAVALRGRVGVSARLRLASVRG